MPTREGLAGCLRHRQWITVDDKDQNSLSVLMHALEVLTLLLQRCQQWHL
jgi:hypothetical protein